MAAILNSITNIPSVNDDFARLKSNPMFSALRETLLTDVQKTTSFPMTLMKTDDKERDDHAMLDPNIAAVQEASLMSDFQQILPLGNTKVLELREFYSSQCTCIENARNKAIEELKENNMLSVSQYQRDLSRIHLDHDQQRMHLTNRVTASLQLLKMNLPSSLEVSSSKSKSRQLNSRAVELMNDWFERHIDSPYPTDDEKLELAEAGGLTLSQVKAWFANKRNRTHNTKPKKQKQQVEKRLLSICTELSTDLPGIRPKYTDIIQQLNELVNTAPVFHKISGRLSDAYNSSGDELDHVHCD